MSDRCKECGGLTQHLPNCSQIHPRHLPVSPTVHADAEPLSGLTEEHMCRVEDGIACMSDGVSWRIREAYTEVRRLRAENKEVKERARTTESNERELAEINRSLHTENAELRAALDCIACLVTEGNEIISTSDIYSEVLDIITKALKGGDHE